MTANKHSNYPTGFANGVTLRNMPVLNTYSGKVFWVDSGAGSDGNKGTFDRPLATIDKAMQDATSAAGGFVTPNNGDIIMVKAGHTEAVTTDGGITCDVAGVAIIGLGTGSDRPTITVSTLAAATVTVPAANVTWHNFLFLGNKSDLVTCFEISGDSCEVSACEFRESTAGMLQGIRIGLVNNDSDYAYIHDCAFYMDEPGVTNVGNSAIALVTDNDHIVIENNHIYGDFDTGGFITTTAGEESDFLIIERNYIENTATGQHAISLATGGTMNGGAVLDNRLVSDATATLLAPHTLQCLGNRGNLGGTLQGDFAIPGYLVGEAGSSIVTSSVTFTAAAHESGTGVTLFTVTGDVMARCYGHVTTTMESDIGNNGAISLGTEDNVAILLPVVVADQTLMTAEDVLANGTGGVQSDVVENGGAYVFIANGENIEMDFTVEDMTAGVITYYCEWYPVTSNGNVV